MPHAPQQTQRQPRPGILSLGTLAVTLSYYLFTETSLAELSFTAIYGPADARSRLIHRRDDTSIQIYSPTIWLHALWPTLLLSYGLYCLFRRSTLGRAIWPATPGLIHYLVFATPCVLASLAYLARVRPVAPSEFVGRVQRFWNQPEELGGLEGQVTEVEALAWPVSVACVVGVLGEQLLHDMYCAAQEWWSRGRVKEE